MEIATIQPFGGEIDLDDPKSLDYLPSTVKECEKLMYSEIGINLVYITKWHPDWDENQCNRIHTLIDTFILDKFKKENRNNLLWYRKQIFYIQNECENMC